jgi:enoyl-[acyl-carrier protein] reductase I
MPGLLAGKFGVITGLSERHGNAWGITQACLREGARLAFTHEERYARHAEQLTADIPGAIRVPLDVTNDEQIARAFDQVDRQFGGLDFLIHSIAGGAGAALLGRVTDTSRADFHFTIDVSAYSLLALTRAAEPLFKRRGGGSVVALTYYGGEKVVLGYKIMGVCKAALDSIGRYLAAELGPDNIRVNLLSLGPVRTMAARGIPGFTDMLHLAEQRAPLRRNIDTSDVGNAAVFLCSDWARNVTGEILHVDGGFHAMGAPAG